MRTQFCAGAFALALLGMAGTAAAQSYGGASGSGASSSSQQLSLTPSQEQSIKQGLAGQQTDSAPAGYQGQIGSALPGSINPHAMPSNVASQVPAAKTLLFVKLPDRVLLVDPQSKMIAEILPVAATTGSSSDSDSSSGMQK